MLNGYNLLTSTLFIIGKLAYYSYENWRQLFNIILFRSKKTHSPLLFSEMEELRKHCIKQVKNFLID